MATGRRPIGAKDAGTPAPATEPKKPESQAADMPPADTAAPAAPSAPAAEPVEPAPSPDTVDPVDTESPDYQAGYADGQNGIDTGSADFKAGYAAGLGASGAKPAAEPDSTPTGPTEPPPEAAKPATASELLAAFPDDKAFCMDQLAAGATLAQAHVARSAVLAERLKAAEARASAAEKALAEETGSPPPVTPARAATKTAEAPEEPDRDAPPEQRKEWAKAKAAHEWDNDPEAKKGFSTKDRYVAYRTQELLGNLRALTK